MGYIREGGATKKLGGLFCIIMKKIWFMGIILFIYIITRFII